ncbi:MAG: hypothetical protein OEZ34_04880 [Spirochaetia bacterium]|nr:hypothetical protein [Spirochaetia bacterium]
MNSIIAFNFGEVSEDWNWIYMDVETAFKNEDISIKFGGSPDISYTIRPANSSPIEIKLSDYTEHVRGYIFVKEGKEIQFQKYDQAHVIIDAASKYFEIKKDH